MVLVRRLVVGVGRRQHHLVHAELVVEVVQHLDHRGRRVSAEERAVGGDPEAAPLRVPHVGHGLLEHTLLAHGGVVALLQPVDVHGPREVRRGRELVDLAGHQQRVGAQVDELLALDQLVDHHLDLGVHQRLAAGDGDQ